MSLVRINRDPTRRQLAVFASLWLLCLGGIGAHVLVQGGSSGTAGACWAAAVLVPLLGCLWPATIRSLYVLAAYAAFPVGFLVSHVVLAAAYYLVLTPTGLAMRLCGHDPLGRRFDRSAASYWVPREPDDRADRYFRQF